MRANGASIYGTQANPFAAAFPWGRVTRAGQRLYLHVFDWPADFKVSVPYAGVARRAYLLSTPGSSLPYESTPQGVTVQLPQDAPDAIDSVIVLEVVDGELAAPASR